MTFVMSQKQATEYQYEKQLKEYRKLTARLRHEIDTLKELYTDAVTKAFMLSHKETAFLHHHPDQLNSHLMYSWKKLYQQTSIDQLNIAVREFAWQDLKHPRDYAEDLDTAKVRLEVLPNPAADLKRYARERQIARERARHKLQG